MAAIGLEALLQDDAFQAGLARYEDGIAHMETLTDQGASLMSKAWAVGAGAVTVASAAVVAGVAGIIAVSKQGIDAINEWGNDLATLSGTLGTTAEQSSVLAIAMKQVGLDVDQGSASLNRFIRGLDDVGKTATGALSPFQKALQTLGVRAYDARGRLRSIDDILPDVMRAFQDLPDGVQKSALAMDLFGQSGTKMLDFLNQGEEGLQNAIRLGKLYGLTLSDDMVQATQDFQNALQITQLGLRGVWVQIGSKVLPIGLKFVNFLNDKLIPPFVEFAQKVAPIVADALGSIENIFELLVTGDFHGGIFGLAEDSPVLGLLFDLRESVVAFWEAIQQGAPPVIQTLGTIGKWFLSLWQSASEGDWEGFWHMFVGGINHALADLEIWGTQIWDWLTQTALPTFQQKAGELVTGIGAWLVQNGPKAWAQLQTWAGELWEWLTEDAIPALATKGAQLITGITTWLSKNGPKAWDALTDWATDFWLWLSGPDGAVMQTSKKLLEAARSIGTWLGLTWDLSIAPALSLWGDKFWDWVQVAVPMATDKLGEIQTAILKWSTDPKTQLDLYAAGYDLGTHIMDGIVGFFDGDEAQENFFFALVKFDRKLAGFKDFLVQIGFNLGGPIGQGMHDSIVRYWTEHDLGGQIYDWLNKSADELSKRLGEIAGRIAADLVAAINDALSHLHLNLPPLQIPGVSQTPTGGGGINGGPNNTGFNFPQAPAQQASFIPVQQTPNAASAVLAQLQAMPFSLVVQIGAYEVQQAVVTWTSEAVVSQIDQAQSLLAQGTA